MNTPLDSIPGLILNQNFEPYGSISLGGATVSHGGCGPIAAYNVLRLLGRVDVSFDDVLDYYKTRKKLLLGGRLGSLPQAIADYLTSQGFSVTKTRKLRDCADLAGHADACVLWYCFNVGTLPRPGAHFVAFKQVGDTGYYLNAFSNSKAPKAFTGSPADFVNSVKGYAPVLIMISGVKQLAHEEVAR